MFCQYTLHLITIQQQRHLADITVAGASSLVRLSAGIAGHDAVPLVYVVSVLARKIVEHAEAVSNNDQHVAEAARRATATQAVLDTLKGADFPSAHPAYVAIVEALAQIYEYASKWGDKSYWTKRLGVSLSKCTMKSLKYKHLFELQFQVRMAVGIRNASGNHPISRRSLTTHHGRCVSFVVQVLESYLHLLTSAVVSEGYAELKQGFAAAAEERERNFRQLVNAQDRTTQSVEELQQSVEELQASAKESEHALSQVTGGVLVARGECHLAAALCRRPNDRSSNPH